MFEAKFVTISKTSDYKQKINGSILLDVQQDLIFLKVSPWKWHKA